MTVPALLSILLRCYPAPFRSRHGRALCQTFEADWRRRPGFASRLRLVADFVVSGLAERLRRTPPSRGPQIPRPLILSGVGSDIRHAWRTLAHRPLFALVTTTTLALGLGATIAMFTVADAVLLRPLPYPDDHQLVVMTEHQADRNLTGVSLPAVADWRAFPDLSSVAMYTAQYLLFQQGDVAERLTGMSVSAEFFDTLRVAPALGRTMHTGEPLLDPDPKIVLSDAVWRRHFKADASVVTRPIVLEGRTYQVIGVMPEGFAFPSRALFWTTLPTSMSLMRDTRSLRFMEVIGRLTPAASVAAAQSRLADWKQRIAPLDPQGGKWLPEVRSLRDEVVGQVRRPLLIVFVGVGFLLLVACCNAAALVLAHARAKMRDLAVQSALGATRGRLVRQLLIEGVLISTASAVAALIVAAITRDGIVALSANQIPRINGVSIDVRTVLFAAGAALCAVLVIALGPALLVTRASMGTTLQRGSRGARASTGRRMFGPLVAVEFAFALLLLSAAALLVTSYRHLSAVDPGFQPAQVVAAKVAVPLTPEWSGTEPNRRFNADLLEHLRGASAVDSAAVITRLPLSDVHGGTDVWPEGDETQKTAALLQLTSERYFDVMGSRVIAGRDFATTDLESTPAVAIVNEVLARRLWPNGGPLHHRVTYQFMRGPATVEIVGVVPGIRYNDLTTDAPAEIYVSFRQTLNTPLWLVVKGRADSAVTVAAMRAALARADASGNVTLADVSTLDAQLTRLLAPPRFYLVMVGVFACVASLLAGLGIYGTMMFWIGERWREFGIRVALGARRADVGLMVLRHGVMFAVAGIAVGLLGAIAGRRLIESVLFQVSPSDPAVLGATIAALLAAACAAAAVPVRRIARVDPASALKD